MEVDDRVVCWTVMEVGDGVVCWTVMDLSDGVVCWTVMELGYSPPREEGWPRQRPGWSLTSHFRCERPRPLSTAPRGGPHRGQRLCVSRLFRL